MRFVHTSDWHLGRSFGGHSLHAHQAEFLGWLVELVRTERVELVVVAGDIYDRAVPPAESVALLRDTLLGLRAAGARVVAIAGNHDSPDRLSAYDGLTDLAGVHIRGGYAPAGEVLRLDFADGPLDVVAVPYLDPVLAPAAAPEGDGADAGRPTHASVLREAMRRGMSRLATPRSMVVAHAFVAGGESSESERLLDVGGTGFVPLSTFDGFSYAALGHLHRPQSPHDLVHYSGTPLAYSFGETHAKAVLLGELSPNGDVALQSVEVAAGRAVATVTGTLEDLLTNEHHSPAADHWVRAVLTDASYITDARARLQQRFPHVVEVVLQPAAVAGRAPSAGSTARRAATPLENAVEFWRSTVGDPTPEVLALLRAGVAVASGLGDDDVAESDDDGQMSLFLDAS